MKMGNLLLLLGILIMAVAVILMIEGSLLGSMTTEIAAILGIIGILIIGFSSRIRKGKPLF
jgi:uncharacterized membrane protein